MRFVLFNGGRLGLVREDWILGLTSVLECDLTEEPTALVLILIQQWDNIRLKLDNRALSNLPEVAVHGARLDLPLPLPGKIVAAPINYLDHKQEMDVNGTVAQLGVFLKANSSVIGPNGIIEVPYNDRRIDQEGELALVIGGRRRGRFRGSVRWITSLATRVSPILPSGVRRIIPHASRSIPSRQSAPGSRLRTRSAIPGS